MQLFAPFESKYAIVPGLEELTHISTVTCEEGSSPALSATCTKLSTPLKFIAFPNLPGANVGVIVLPVSTPELPFPELSDAESPALSSKCHSAARLPVVARAMEGWLKRTKSSPANAATHTNTKQVLRTAFSSRI